MTATTELDLAVWPMFYRMTKKGIRVAIGKLEALRDEVDKLAWSSAARASELAGVMFNPSSGDQVAELLTKRGWKGKLTKGGRLCTDEKSLAQIDDPIVPRILEHRGHIKLLGTFIQPTLEKAKTGGRVHPKWKLTTVRSGRVACEDPNMMAFPSRDLLGLKVRGCFIADPGMVMFSIDYSQIEPRIVAALSGEPALLTIYKEGRDLYDEVAAALGVDRMTAKTGTLGIFYGMEERLLSERLKMVGVTKEVEECRQFIDEWFHRYPQVAALKEDVARSARANGGVVHTYGGRGRLLPALHLRGAHWPNQKLRSEAERQAFSHVIQGDAQEFMKQGMVACESPAWDPLLQLHDELVGQVPEELESTLVPAIAEDMEFTKIFTTLVNLPTEFETGPDWASLKG